MQKIPVTVVFDIGKTNKKVLAFDEEFRVVYDYTIRFGESTDEDGFACESLQTLENFMFDSLHAVSRIKGLDIKSINFSAYGSSLVYIGDDGKPLTPLYNYLKPYPPDLINQFFEFNGGKNILEKKSATKIEGSINAGLQIYSLKYSKRELFEATKYVLHLPQYLSYLFSEKAFSEITSIGCHTGLWDFEKNDYHDWVHSENIAEKLPPIVSSDTVTLVSFDDKKLLIGVGLHDSSASLIPYQQKSKEPFILISTGTWCVSMNAFANFNLTEVELKKGCVCYKSADGRNIKASRTMLGKKFEEGTPINEIINEQIESTRMIMAGTDIKQIFVDGGFSKNEEYMQGLKKQFNGIKVQAAEIPHASAIGAAMLMKKLLPILFCIFSLNVFAQKSVKEIFAQAHWITYPLPEDSIHPCPVFKKSFVTNKTIKSATLYITAHGLYEARINNKRVGNDYFTPGFTSYDKRLQYQKYDVTALIKKNNEVRVTVGDGWWRGVFGGDLANNRFGDDASILFQLNIVYADGSTQTIVSDKNWLCGESNILYSNIYNGEIQNLNNQTTHWINAKESDFNKDILVESVSEPVRKQEQFRPIKIFKNKNGEQIIDFGQNMAGWVQLKINGHAGDTIKLWHTESLDRDSNFYTGNLREADAEDIYILKNGAQTLEPHFTYHGFRYALAEGFTPTKVNCTAIALHTDLKHTGTFSCSNPMINQLQHNIEWSLNSNFFDIPTDCPQRSERLGWAGDAEIFCATAAYNRNVKNFFEKWLADVRADQSANGAVPIIVPDIYFHLDSVKKGVAGWGDAATIVPWTLYEIYGDTNILKKQYASMKSWVDYIAHTSKNYLWTAGTYGDWYAPGPATDKAFIDECFFGYSTQLVIRTATVLNQKTDIGKYSELLKNIKTAFLKKYSKVPETQTAYILALQFEMLPDSLKQQAVKNLINLIHQNNDHLATGFLGTPYILSVLSDNGYLDLAYKILNQKTIPSWLYPITKGATTIWEKWDAIDTDGTFDTCSLNHYAYGAVGNWLYQTVAGINATSSGYKDITIHPHPGGGLTWVKASYQCNYGSIVSSWKIQGDTFILYAEIPTGTTATIILPDGKSQKVRAGKYMFKSQLKNKQ